MAESRLSSRNLFKEIAKALEVFDSRVSTTALMQLCHDIKASALRTFIVFTCVCFDCRYDHSPYQCLEVDLHLSDFYNRWEVKSL
jgi:hypothetical protein